MSGLAEILEENLSLRQEMARLRATLAAKDDQLAAKDDQLTVTREQLDAVTRKAEYLAQKLELANAKHTGAASQRYVPPEQVALPFSVDLVPPPRAPKIEEAAPQPGRRRRRGEGRPRRRTRDDVANLPARTVRCKAAETPCASCGKPLKVIGLASSFRIEWVPGHFEVHDVVRDKCACPDCPGEGVLTTPAPYILDRSLAANGLLARVLVDKFVDHIPANRQAKRMKREGFDVGSHTLSAWIGAVGDLLTRVAAAVRTDLLAGSFLQGDDTGMPVQDAGNGRLRKGRMWAFTDQEQVFYAFTDSKEGRFPVELLEGYAGELLLVDGGSEFNQVVREQGLTRGGCWSHLRKRFFEALKHHPAEAHLGLGTIRDLFLIEREIWGGDPAAIVAARQARSRPLVDGMFEWLKALSQVARPDSLLGEAVRYGRNQEKELRAFLEHGELPIHNNLSELMLRQPVVGRKNWLFARSEGGAKAAAAVYTLVGSCMLQGVDPWAYLRDVLDRLLDHPANRIGELTPKRWVAERSRHMVIDG